MSSKARIGAKKNIAFLNKATYWSTLFIRFLTLIEITDNKKTLLPYLFLAKTIRCYRNEGNKVFIFLFFFLLRLKKKAK